MRIAFHANHAYYGGLSNNGGSKTIICSAAMLRKLGHRCEIVARSDKFNYFPHRKPVKKIPKNTDVLIAVSVSELREVNKFPGRKAFWMRGYEVWHKVNVINEIKSFKGKVICNSGWQVRKLAKHGIKAELCFAGFDPVWDDLRQERKEKPTIGCLYHKFHKTKNYEFFRHVKRRLGDDYYYQEIGRKPMNDEELKKVYQECDIWFAPTCLEGFHNVPLEAALCGAVVVCSDHPRNGMSDYCGEHTSQIYEYGNLDDAVKKIREVGAFHEKIVWNDMEECIRDHIGTRKYNMERMVKLLRS